MAPVGRILRSARLTRPLVARNQRGGEQEGARDVHGHQGRHHRHRRSDLQGRRPGRGRAIAAIGPNLSGDTVLDAAGALRHARRHRSAHPSRNAVHGHHRGGDFESGTRAALSGGTTMVVDFVPPRPRQSLLDALAAWDSKRSGKASSDYSFHMCVTWWGEQVFEEMAEVVDRGINTFKHFMAYKGALMVNDDEMFASFPRCAELGALPLVHAENGDVVARAAAEVHGRRQHRARGPRLFAPARGRGRGDQPRHHDRRRGRRAALRRARLLRAGARGDPPRPPAGHARLRRAADPAPRRSTRASISTRTGTTPRAA